MTYLFYTNLALWFITTAFIPKLFELCEKNHTLKPLIYYVVHGLFTIATIIIFAASSLWRSL